MPRECTAFTCNFNSSSAHSGIALEEQSNGSSYGMLVDMNVETCINAETMLQGNDHFMTELSVVQRIDNGLVTVYFNQTVECEGRQVR